MLRASSLGLTLPSTTIFTGQTCRRLCGVRTRLLHAPVGLTNTSVATPTREVYRFTSGSTHRHQDRENVGNLRVADVPERLDDGPLATETPSPAQALEAVEETSGQPTPVGYTHKDVSPLEPSELMKTFILQEDIEALSIEEHKIRHERASSTVVKQPSFAAGRPWAMGAIKPVFFSALEEHLQQMKEDIEAEHRNHIGEIHQTEDTGDEGQLNQQPPSYEILTLIQQHIDALGRTQAVEEAWHAYVSLIDYIIRLPYVSRNLPYIPFSHLHRLCRLLARNRPKTHRQYLRLLAVMTYIKHCGGRILQHEYNALVDHAGRGWRKTRKEEVEQALSVFKCLQMGRLPGVEDEDSAEGRRDGDSAFQPDIYTFTSLLSVAARAMDTSQLHNISALMARAGLPPNRITHLSLLHYFTKQSNLNGVRATLQKMRLQDLELGLDGLNACIWAYGYNERVDIAMMIYRVLRHNAEPEEYVGEGDIRHTLSQLVEEYIFIEPEMRANEVTYTTIIQIMAYHGQFRATLNIFADMLSFDNTEIGAPLVPDECGELKPAPYNPSIAVFRSIFLGFSKFGVPANRVYNPDDVGWSLVNLGHLFERFLDLPQDSKLTYATVDIIMKAFAVTSGTDLDIMRNVWTAMEKRFGPFNFAQKENSRLVQLKAKIFAEKPTDPG